LTTPASDRMFAVTDLLYGRESLSGIISRAAAQYHARAAAGNCRRIRAIVIV